MVTARRPAICNARSDLARSLVAGKATPVRQVSKERVAAHHDALEFPDGRTELLTMLCEGQAATVLQLPVQPTTTAEADAQKRVAYAD
jgi:hypothetical protein